MAAHSGWQLSQLEFMQERNVLPPDDVLMEFIDRVWDDVFQPRTLDQMNTWLLEFLEIPSDQLSWRRFNEQHERKRNMCFNLTAFAVSLDYKENNLEYYEKTLDLSRFANYIEPYFAELLRFRFTTTPRDEQEGFASLIPGFSTESDSDFQKIFANAMDYEAKDHKNFQRLFLGLLKILHTSSFRRSNGSFFVRVVTEAGLPTLAFQEETTIESFVYHYTSHNVNFEMWKLATDPVSNANAVVEYLTTHPIDEARDLDEANHLRSYEGDEVGRGSGIYDDRTDMFWPYAMRGRWRTMAEDMQRMRRQLSGREVSCEPPSPHEVALLHLPCTFPYDVHGEVSLFLSRAPPHLQWVQVCEHECYGAPLAAPSLAAHLATAVRRSALEWEEVREEEDARLWTGKAADQVASLLENGERRVDDPDLVAGVQPASHYLRLADGRLFRPKAGPLRNVRRPDVVGDTWTSSPIPPPDDASFVDVRHVLGNERIGRVLRAEPLEDAEQLGLSMDTFFEHDGRFFYPNLTPSSTRPHVLTQEQFDSFGVDAASVREGAHVVWEGEDGERLHFRRAQARGWMDCDTPEVDTIFDYQGFTPFDKSMLYGLMGRLFFEVGERDNFELTVFIEGVGGCGKSTIMKLVQSFWPAHLRGILSPNTEPKYGMSNVATSRVIFCNEVSGDLQIVQEEWQTSVSNETGSYARKFKDPLVITIKAQHFWIGNGFPGSKASRNTVPWNNQQGQVSRRLAGVLMSYPVKKRDGSILDRMKRNLGVFHRKVILAYEEFVRKWGTTDPMSVPRHLPPAFREFYRRGRRATDPIEDFLSDGSYVTCKQGESMTMDRFRELYSEYRVKYDLGKAVRWEPDLYRTPFNERGIQVQRVDKIVLDGVEYSNVEVLRNIAPVDN